VSTINRCRWPDHAAHSHLRKTKRRATDEF